MMKSQSFFFSSWYFLSTFTSSLSQPTRSCYDYPASWHDRDGPTFNCEWYSQDSHCSSHGDNYSNRGYTANEACCACGGGVWYNTDSPTESPIFTLEPTGYPTRSPTEDIVPCRGYITGYYTWTTGNDTYNVSTYESNAHPQPLECGSSYGDDWMPQYQGSSCCTNEAHYKNAIGGFDYELQVASGVCMAHADSMKSILCDPDQGRYIDDNGFLRVCQSSCEALFEACGMPGEAYPASADYDDAKGLCYQLWDGFGSNRWGSSNTCDTAPDKNYVCETGLHIYVVDGDDCLAMSKPSTLTIAYYDDLNKRRNNGNDDNDRHVDPAKPSFCNDGFNDENYESGHDVDSRETEQESSGPWKDSLGGTIVFIVLIVLLIGSVMTCCRSCYKNLDCIFQDNGLESDFASEAPPTAHAVHSTSNNTRGGVGGEEPEIEVPTASVVSPSAPPLPVAVPATLTPVPFRPMAMSGGSGFNDQQQSSEGGQNQLHTSKQRERRSSSLLSTNNTTSTSTDLSFEQKLDLRELEHEKDAGIISEERYRERLGEIMSRSDGPMFPSFRP